MELNPFLDLLAKPIHWFYSLTEKVSFFTNEGDETDLSEHIWTSEASINAQKQDQDDMGICSSDTQFHRRQQHEEIKNK